MKRHRFRKGLAGVTILVLGACGGGGGAAPADYVRAVCQATTTWQGDVQKEALALAGSLDPSAEPSEQKQGLVGLLDRLTSVTDRFIDRVEAAGFPDIEDGEEAAASLTEALGKLNQAFRDAREEAEQLPTDTREAFDQAAGKIGQTINESVEVIADPFQGKAEQLATVAQDEPACKNLQG